MQLVWGPWSGVVEVRASQAEQFAAPTVSLYHPLLQDLQAPSTLEAVPRSQGKRTWALFADGSPLPAMLLAVHVNV